ncbi:WhiB family transcription factor [Mycobacterium phage MiaZeal]|uniref:WhiB family transcription factor n=1 Tax=Mycobacterium phage MiaZeal TaxID=1567005 RepID=UPI000540FE62|nr:WhiB family transcription factor [Mycobacterium phage MiaZeal]AIY32483.1 WhiB family transcription factor [Mycobacterium phage MiaZeal]
MTTTPCFGKSDIFCDENENGGKGAAEAKKICWSQCTRREKCLEEALRFEEHEPVRLGVWGGLSANERNKIYGRKSS